MYQVKDFVVLGATGVCQIVDICKDDFGDEEVREYYVLDPVGGNGLTINIPTDNQTVSMRRAMTKKEIHALLRTVPDGELVWTDDDNTRRNTYSEALHSGDQHQLVQMVRTIQYQKEELEKEGKKLPGADVEALKTAEKMLYHEFALVLNIEPEQVIPFILKKISI